MGRIRRFLATAGTAGLLLTAGALIPATASAAGCPTGWGSAAKTSDIDSAATLTGVSAGRYQCFDRVVLKLKGAPDGYDVRYVDGFSTDGEGRTVPARGGAKLQVIVRSHAYTDAGRATYTPAKPTELFTTSGARTLRQGVWLGSFEGQSTVGVGVRARLPYRVTVVDDPGPGARMVVDVAHTW